MNTATRDELLAAALGYAARGWPVLPLHTPVNGRCSCGKNDCASPGKHPRLKNGLKEATRDIAIIHGWWKQWPSANIGILTGSESGIVVLDVDGKQGEDSLCELEARYGPLPNAFTVKTARGLHFYFAYPAGIDVRNSAGKIALGLDVRGQDGYVVGAPSLHASGVRYEIA